MIEVDDVMAGFDGVKGRKGIARGGWIEGKVG